MLWHVLELSHSDIISPTCRPTHTCGVSQKLPYLATQNSALKSNYHTAIIAANTGKQQPYQELSMCLQYLIRIQS